MRTTFWLMYVLSGVSCAGLRAIPATATPDERLAIAEEVLVNAPDLTATFEVEAEGPTAASFSGTVHLYDRQRAHLQADGKFRGAPVTITLDGRDGSGVNRSLSGGAVASSHKDPPAPKLREAVALGALRLGLSRDLMRLASDQPLDTEGTSSRVRAVMVSDGHSETVGNVACHRVSFAIEIDRQPAGEASVCIADATGLVVQRRATLKAANGETTVTERYTWKVR